jgi:hypothetical protein
MLFRPRNGGGVPHGGGVTAAVPGTRSGKILSSARRDEVQRPRPCG